MNRGNMAIVGRINGNAEKADCNPDKSGWFIEKSMEYLQLMDPHKSSKEYREFCNYFRRL